MVTLPHMQLRMRLEHYFSRAERSSRSIGAAAVVVVVAETVLVLLYRNCRIAAASLLPFADRNIWVLSLHSAIAGCINRLLLIARRIKLG